MGIGQNLELTIAILLQATVVRFDPDNDPIGACGTGSGVGRDGFAPARPDAG